MAQLTDMARAQAPRWRVRLLGDVRATDDAGAVIARWPSRAAALLLARLALWPQRAHPREELVDALWPAADLEVGRNRLRQVLSTLKSLLEPPGAAPVIVADRAAVRVVPGALACDALEFEACARADRREAAFALYLGPLLPGHYDDWVLDERQRFEALAERMEFAALSIASPVAPAAEAMRVPAEGASLPSYLTRLHGAGPALDAIEGAVIEHRLVTLTGPGGTGKTRLAVEVARKLAASGRFDRVLFVPLVGAATTDAVADALAQALHCEPALDAWATALAGRRALLLVDNCEQVAEAAASAVTALLAYAPLLHVLATSRRALGVDGEKVRILAALATPDPHAPAAELAGNPAVALFVDRARLARTDFHVTDGNAAALAGLMRRLEGMPLAIELAAARVRTLGPAQMLALLEHRDGAALSLVARPGPRSSSDARHASMVQVVDWSWRLLSDGARRLMADMALFPGGFTLEAAQAVTGASMAQTAAWLDELVEHSMLRPALDGERFALYEVIREFGIGQLSDEPLVRARQAQRAWLLRWAAALPATPPLDAVRAEMPNIVAVLAGCDAQADAAADAVQLLSLLRRTFDDVEPPAAALRHLEAAIEACADEDRAARGRSLLAGLLFNAGRAADAVRQAELGWQGCVRLDVPSRARALHALASVRWRATKDGAGSLALLDRAEPLAEAAGALDVQASVCALRAFVVNLHHRDPVQARALHERALSLWRQLGNQHAVNSGLYNLAVVASRAGEPQRALELVEAVLDSARHLGDAHRERQALNVQGNALVALRRWREAADALRQCVRQSWQASASHDLAYGLWNLPRPLAHLRQPEPALRLMAFAAAFWSGHFGALSAEDRLDLRRIRRLAGRGLTPSRVEALWHAGEQMSLADAVTLALG